MKQTATDREKFFWNMMGSLANALSSIVLSVSVNRILDGESGGVFALAYSNAQLMLTIGQFEVRQYQGTDVTEKYSFWTYRKLRVLTCMLMMAATLGYVLWNRNAFTREQSTVIFLLSAFKMVEGYTDVYGGRFQQENRIDLSGKIFFIRVTVSTALFIAALLMTGNLTVSSAMLFAASASLFFLYDRKYTLPRKKAQGTGSAKDVAGLARDVLPLFLQAFCLMYINNAPKYAISHACSQEIQNIYNILFMPTFAINLFGLFIFRPMMLQIANTWSLGKFREFGKRVAVIFGLILTVTVFALIGTWLLGIPILSALYGVDLEAYRGDLVIAMAAGGVNALCTFLYYVIIAIRSHKLLPVGYGCAFLFSAAAAGPFVGRWGIQGGILNYLCSVTVLAGAYLLIFCAALGKRKTEKKMSSGE